ncbi:hypothetical protein LTR56_017791 [Elasticomyces elasticus]|nr:hypothetical protein LTR56_017791 [Elasticomyces elasticus]KAK3662292.1 hypothetical protein LTR22_006825 [Elasticomyces elasticus]KAK5766825.1 hypothetical protein LTS12_002901 [Elasticomyces elasticus]
MVNPGLGIGSSGDVAMNESQRQSVAAALCSPRIVFRASSDQSRGGAEGNTQSLIDPLAGQQSQEYHHHFMDMEWAKARTMLEDHLVWTYSEPSHFASWSSSLQWVMGHGARKRDLGEPNILIYVLDTAKIKDQERMFRAEDLVATFGLHKDHPELESESESEPELDSEPEPEIKQKRKGSQTGKKVKEKNKKKKEKNKKKNQIADYAHGEYLVYGKLSSEDGFTAVRLDTLIDAGLIVCFKDLDVPARKAECEKEMDSLAHSLDHAYSEEVRLDAEDICLNDWAWAEFEARQIRWKVLYDHINDLGTLYQRITSQRHKWFFKVSIEDMSKKDRKKEEKKWRERMAHGSAECKEFSFGKEHWLLPRNHFEGLRKLGQCFGAALEGLMTMSFVSLRRRNLQSADVQEVLSVLDGLPMLRISPTDNEENVHDHIEERMQLLQLLHRHQTRADDREEEEASLRALTDASHAEAQDERPSAAEESAIDPKDRGEESESRVPERVIVVGSDALVSRATKRQANDFDMPAAKLTKREC